MSQVVIVGNATSDAELRYTAGGKGIASFSVAESKGKGDKKQTYYWKITVWNSDYDLMADNVAASVTKGTRVIVSGRAEPNEWTDKEGNVRKEIQVTADAVGLDLRYATGEVSRTEREKVDTTPAIPDDDPMMRAF
jgi:single-strand DNA-binding protein